MGHIRFRRADELQWMAPQSGTADAGGEVYAEARYEPAPADHDERCHRIHHEGSESELQLFELRLPAGDGFDSHAHETDEIILVAEGELRAGRRRLGPGSSVYVPAHTLYSFHAGPAGLRFYNFRAVKDESFMTKDEFLSHRRRD